MDKLQKSALEAMLEATRSDEARQRIRETVARIVASGYQRITRRLVAETIDVHLIRIIDRRTSDEQAVQELGIELKFLIRTNPGGNFLVSFANVQAIGSGVLAKLVSTHKLTKALGGKLILTSINPQLYEPFETTKLDQLFDIRVDEADAMAAF